MEIAIILSVVLAATRGLAHRGKWIWAGLAGGVAGSALVALFADNISNAMEGMGQEIFNAAVLFMAVFMIGWTVIWMQSHGRAIAQKIKDTGKKISDGELPLYALAVIVSITMWREGSEIVLFMYGILSTSKESLLAIAAGSAGGTLAAGTLGLLLYLGLVKFSTRYVFSFTSWLLILLACGMSAHAAGLLTAADVLPALSYQVWDTSAILSEDSMLGKILHAMLGYTARPTGIQCAFYVLTFITITGLQKIMLSDSTFLRKLAGSTVGLALITAALILISSQQANALNVNSPYVEEGMLEVELKNRYDIDDRSSEDNFRQHILEVKYGVTNWWAFAVEGEWEKDPDDGYHYEATEIESIFQLTDVGEYWLDAGIKTIYVFKHPSGTSDRMKVYALLAKQYTEFTHVANLGIEQDVGNNKNRNPKFDAKWMTQYHYTPMISPGFEYYGEYGEISDPSDYDAQKHRLGPVIYGNLGNGFKYNLGWLFGLSDATEDHAIKLNLEYEFPVEFY